jgi:nucleoside-triphosphatase THEP1
MQRALETTNLNRFAAALFKGPLFTSDALVLLYILPREKMATTSQRKPVIFMLTGAVHSGKTSRLKRVVDELRETGVEFQGYLSQTVKRKDKIDGYNLLDLGNGKVSPFIRKRGAKNWEKIGSYYFLPSSLARSRAIIRGRSDNVLLIVDEIGPLELQGQGVWPALKEIIVRPSTFALLVIRRNILEEFLKLLPKLQVRVFDIDEKDGQERLIQEILGKARIR